MSKPQTRPLRRWLGSLAVLGVGGAVLYADLAPELLDRSLAAAWITTGDALIGRDLKALEGRVAKARAGQAEFRALRDALAGQLRALEGRRATVRSRVDHQHALLEQAHDWQSLADDPGAPSGELAPGRAEPGGFRSALHVAADATLARYLESSRELARLDATLVDLEAALARADLNLDRAEARLETRSGELAVLQAMAGSRVLHRAEASLHDPFAGCERPARAATLLGCDSPASPAP